MIKVVQEQEPGPAVEHCAICRQKTKFWYEPKDVACCTVCALQVDAEDLPTKEQWCKREGILMKPRIDRVKTVELTATSTATLGRTNGEVQNRSGNYKTKNPLVAFIYLLLRDCCSASEIEAAAEQAYNSKAEIALTNGWLALYAEDVARSLSKPRDGLFNTRFERIDNKLKMILTMNAKDKVYDLEIDSKAKAVKAILSALGAKKAA